MLSKVCKSIVQLKNTQSLFYSIVQFQSTQESGEKSQQQEQQFHSENKRSRTIEAEKENEKIVIKRERISNARLIWRIFFYGSIALFSYNLFLVNNSKDPDNQLGAVPYYLDAAKYVQSKYQDLYDFLTKPPLQKMLPDQPTDIPGFMPPKTLVLNLEGTLVCTEYVLGKGIQIKKRPGLKKFLQGLQQAGYEVVLFTDSDTQFTQQVGQILDPQQMIFQARFGSESLSFEKGHYIRDLQYINRDLKKVVVVDKKENLVKKQRDNAIVIPEFKGDPEDKILLELIPLIQHLGNPQIRDVRSEINRYGQIEPYKVFLEELQQKKKLMSEQKSKGMGGLIQSMANQKQTARFR